MARQFTASSSQYLEGSPSVTSMPLTMACWFNADDVATNHVLMALSVVGGIDRWALTANGVTGDFINAATAVSGLAGIAASSATFSAGTWHHAVAVFTSATSRTAYLDGANSGTNATNITPTGIDVFHVGARYNTTLAGYPNARIAEACIYGAALTAEQIAMLAKGVSPLLVAPESLASYWPLIGRTSPEIDLVGGFGLTLVNAPTTGDHCRVFYPKGLWVPSQRVRISGSVGISFNVPAIDAVGVETISGTMEASFNVPAIDAAGVETITGAVDVPIGVPAIDASGEETIAGAVGMSFDVPAIDATGTETITGTLEVSFDVPPILAYASTADAQGCGCMEVLTATGVLEATVVLSEMTVLLATAEMEVIVCEGC